jgi:hypothetical protein
MHRFAGAAGPAPSRPAAAERAVRAPSETAEGCSAVLSAAMSWDLRHRRSALVIRLLLAIWITAVVVVLCATGRWWGVVFVGPLALDVYLLRRGLAAGDRPWRPR